MYSLNICLRFYIIIVLRQAPMWILQDSVHFYEFPVHGLTTKLSTEPGHYRNEVAIHTQITASQ